MTMNKRPRASPNDPQLAKHPCFWHRINCHPSKPGIPCSRLQDKGPRGLTAIPFCSRARPLTRGDVFIEN